MGEPHNTDDLAELLPNPEPVTINGKPVTVKKILIGQMPGARTLAVQLFDAQWLAAMEADYPIDLTDRQIYLMKQLGELMSDQSVAQLEMPTMELMRLFNAALQANADFFLQIMMRVMSPPVGATSSNDSSNMDIRTPNN